MLKNKKFNAYWMKYFKNIDMHGDILDDIFFKKRTIETATH